MANMTEFEAQEVSADARVPVVLDSGATMMALPEGYNLHSLEEFQAAPNRMRANHKFRDTRSLAFYLGRFQKAASLAFSDPDKRTIRVVVDYHDNQSDAPAHGDHVASFVANFTPEYAAWREKSGKPQSQVGAGMFLEDRAVDVIEPDAATIMDMVMQFDALKKVTFRQSTRLHDGQRQFTYSEENEARGNVTLPEQITLLVPVFEGQEPERIKVRVRYRIDDGKLLFQFDIADIRQIENTAFERCENALSVDAPEGLLILRAALGF